MCLAPSSAIGTQPQYHAQGHINIKWKCLDRDPGSITLVTTIPSPMFTDIHVYIYTSDSRWVEREIDVF